MEQITLKENNMSHLGDIWQKIAAVTKEEIRIAVLKDEIEIYKSRLNPSHSKIDVLYLQDTIGIIEHRISELEPPKGNVYLQHEQTLTNISEKT